MGAEKLRQKPGFFTRLRSSAGKILSLFFPTPKPPAIDLDILKEESKTPGWIKDQVKKSLFDLSAMFVEARMESRKELRTRIRALHEQMEKEQDSYKRSQLQKQIDTLAKEQAREGEEIVQELKSFIETVWDNQQNNLTKQNPELVEKVKIWGKLRQLQTEYDRYIDPHIQSLIGEVIGSRPSFSKSRQELEIQQNLRTRFNARAQIMFMSFQSRPDAALLVDRDEITIPSVMRSLSSEQLKQKLQNIKSSLTSTEEINLRVHNVAGDALTREQTIAHEHLALVLEYQKRRQAGRIGKSDLDQKQIAILIHAAEATAITGEFLLAQQICEYASATIKEQNINTASKANHLLFVNRVLETLTTSIDMILPKRMDSHGVYKTVPSTEILQRWTKEKKESIQERLMVAYEKLSLELRKLAVENKEHVIVLQNGLSSLPQPRARTEGNIQKPSSAQKTKGPKADERDIARMLGRLGIETNENPEGTKKKLNILRIVDNTAPGKKKLTEPHRDRLIGLLVSTTRYFDRDGLRKMSKDKLLLLADNTVERLIREGAFQEETDKTFRGLVLEMKDIAHKYREEAREPKPSRRAKSAEKPLTREGRRQLPRSNPLSNHR